MRVMLNRGHTRDDEGLHAASSSASGSRWSGIRVVYVTMGITILATASTRKKMELGASDRKTLGNIAAIQKRWPSCASSVSNISDVSSLHARPGLQIFYA